MSRILVVDDNFDAARALMRLAQRMGHDVQCAYDGAQAILTARASKPDLIILDVMMPDMDGLDVLTRIKQDDSTAGATVVMFSAVRDPETINLARRQGAADFWLKGSFDFSELGPRIALLTGSSPGWVSPFSPPDSRDLCSD